MCLVFLYRERFKHSPCAAGRHSTAALVAAVRAHGGVARARRAAACAPARGAPERAGCANQRRARAQHRDSGRARRASAARRARAGLCPRPVVCRAHRCVAVSRRSTVRRTGVSEASERIV